MALPLLPGFSFNKNIGKDKYHRSHIFERKNGIGYMFNDNKLGIGGEPLPGQRIEAPRSVFPKSDGPLVPAYVAYDKIALSFDAYSQEGVHEKREERYRIRLVKIFFYPEDDTIQILEPRIKNSGIPQGTILKRRRVNKPSPCDNLFYTVNDFNIGKEIDIYGKRHMGVKLGYPEEVPQDPYSELRQHFEASMTPKRPYEKIHKERKFLDHDRHVLRFYCVWDDTKQLYGDLRRFCLHYFLADDTIELIERVIPNSGRDTNTIFLKRSKLPKGNQPLSLPGAQTDRTVLNVVSTSCSNPAIGSNMMLDNLKLGQVKIDYYTHRDLNIGATLDIFGRKMVITSCDDFTKKYYKERYGINDQHNMELEEFSKTVPLPKKSHPWNGWGSYEDSLGNCRSFMPKPLKKDFRRFLYYGRNGLISNEFRFLAKLVSNDPLECERRFRISFFLVDGTILIREVASSFSKGQKYLERRRIERPNQPKYDIEVPEYYKAADFYVGAVIKIFGREFLLYEIDEFALKYMEDNADSFPFADFNKIMNDLKNLLRDKKDQMLAYAKSLDYGNCRMLRFEDFLKFMHYICHDLVEDKPKLDLVTHEMITVARKFEHKPNAEINLSKLISLTRHHLKRNGFTEFIRVQQQLRHEDENSSGTLLKENISRVLKANHMAIPENVLETLFKVYQTEDRRVKYLELISSINWMTGANDDDINQVPPEYSGFLELDWFDVVTDQPQKSFQDRINVKTEGATINSVYYEKLIDALTSN